MVMTIQIFSLFFLFASYVRASSFDLYPASGHSNAPVVIYVHGGAWISGSKEQYRFVGDLLSKSGLCAVVMDYSLAPNSKHPVPVDELNQVLDNVVKTKSKNCDFNKMYLVGHSAGAHMIAFWNTKYSNNAVKGLVGIEGIYDLVKLAKRWPGYKDWFLNSAFGSEKNWAGASPARVVPKSKTKWLLVHSKADELVDVPQTENFKASLVKNKISVEPLMLEKENHFSAIEAALKSKTFKTFIHQ